uniref:Uncharacterized protein n=1 Tax=Nothobranchius furzeri TaxID=105023 RepID=A0A8C6PUB1_NOTFU
MRFTHELPSHQEQFRCDYSYDSPHSCCVAAQSRKIYCKFTSDFGRSRNNKQRERWHHVSTKGLWFIFCSLPVLRILLMELATCPFSREFSSLTSRMRQLHRTNREQVRRIRPTAKSDREQSTNRCLPVSRVQQTWRKDM